MYMQPVCSPALSVEPHEVFEFRPQLAARKVRPLALKLAVGSLFLLIMALIMPLYWVSLGAWLAVASLGKLTVYVAKLLYETIRYAGEAVVGR